MLAVTRLLIPTSQFRMWSRYAHAAINSNVKYIADLSLCHYCRREDETNLELSEGDDSDICEPLSTSMVCQSLNDSETLCQPSQWAGDAIQDAINATHDAMRDLQHSLQAVPRDAC